MARRTEDDKQASVLEVGSNRRLGSLPWGGQDNVRWAFSPDGRFIVEHGGDFERNARLLVYDAVTLRELTNLRGHAKAVNTLGYSGDGRLLVTGSDDGFVRLWDTSTGKLERAFPPVEPGWIYQVGLVADGRFVLARSGKKLFVWERSSGQLVWQKEMSGYEHGFDLSPDGATLATVLDSGLALYDRAQPRLLRTLLTEGSRVVPRFSPDGRFLLAARRLAEGQVTALTLWNLATGKEVWTVRGEKGDNIGSLAFSRDGTRIAALGTRLRLREQATGRELRTYELPDALRRGLSQGREFDAVAFLASGALVATGAHGAIGIWNDPLRSPGRTLSAHQGTTNALAVSPDGRKLATGGDDARTRIWDTGRWSELVTLLGVEGDGWLSLTPDLYFDSSRRGGDGIAMVQGLDAFGIDQLALRLNRPDIILERLGSTDRPAIAHLRAQHERRLRKAGLTETALSGKLHLPTAWIEQSSRRGRQLTLRLVLSDAAVPLKSYNVYANDVPLFGAEGKALTGARQKVTEVVELAAGTNKIEVSCTNSQGVESYRAQRIARYDARPKGDLYFLGFGVSKYRDSTLDLSYADKDVNDLAAAFARMQGTGFEHVFVKTWVNEGVTPEAVRQAKSTLAPAKVDDTLVVFIAGHGMHDQDREATYYFLTHGADVANLATTAVTFDEVSSLVQGVAPRNRLFLMDTCESGEADESIEGRYLQLAKTQGIQARAVRGLRKTAAGKPARASRAFLFDTDRYIYNDLSRRSGAIVFSSSKGSEFSYESDELHNGFFTREILEALSGDAADQDKDGRVSTDELRDFVGRQVAKMTGGLQNPTVDRDNIYQRFGFVPQARASGTR